jgi:hypothetical protein
MFLGSEHACFEVQQQYLDKKCLFIFLSKYLFMAIWLLKIARVPRALSSHRTSYFGTQYYHKKMKDIL